MRGVCAGTSRYRYVGTDSLGFAGGNLNKMDLFVKTGLVMIGKARSNFLSPVIDERGVKVSPKRWV